MNSDLILQQRISFGRKRKIQLVERDSWLLASGGPDIISVDGLPDGGSVVIYKEEGQWLVMAIDAEFVLNGDVKQSAALSVGDQLNVGDTNFDVQEDRATPDDGTIADQELANKKSNRTRFLLFACLCAALIFLAIVVVTSGNKESASDDVIAEADQGADLVGEPEQQSGVKPSRVETSNDKDQVGDEAQSATVQPPIVQNSGAYEYYRRASNYYDLGFLQRAIKTLQQGLAAYPNDTILANKLDAWQRNLSSELSRQFRDGCLHARYFRNLEAKHAFAMVVEMSINESDIRFKEARRLLDKLKNDASAKVECGMKADEN